MRDRGGWAGVVCGLLVLGIACDDAAEEIIAGAPIDDAGAPIDDAGAGGSSGGAGGAPIAGSDAGGPIGGGASGGAGGDPVGGAGGMPPVDDSVVSGGCDLDFVPCGGELLGLWNVQDFCMAFDQQGGLDGCPDATLDVEIDWPGTVEFTADRFTTTWRDRTQRTTYNAPKRCLGDASCQETFADSVCEEDPDTCHCTQIEVSPPPPPQISSYTTEGNEIAVTDEMGGVTRSEYCVMGDQLVIRSVLNPDEGSRELTIVLIR